MAENEAACTIDEESKAMLEEHVKKGKARKFILICKGASIESLTVFKKGPYGPKVMQAKKAGFRGVAFCGVVSGKGVNIDFQLPGNSAVSEAMGAEGNVYDSEPCKVAKLRDFLADEDLKFKPTITIVQSVDAVYKVSETDDAGAEESESEETSAEEEEVSATKQPEASDPARQALVDAMKKLLPKVQQAIQAAPARKAEILAPTVEFNDHIKSGDFAAAKQVLTNYVPFLKEILAGSSTDESAPWRQAVERVEPRYLAVLSKQPANATALRAVWEYAAEQANAKKFTAAVTALDRLEKMLDEAEKQGAPKDTDVIPKGIVSEMARRIEKLRDSWREVRVRSVEGLNELLSVLELSDDAELLEIGSRVQALAFSIPAQLEASLAALSAAVDSGDAGQIQAQKRNVQTVLQECVAYLKQNQHPIDCCENNPFGVTVSVRQPLAQSLKEISTSLQAV